MRLLKLRKQPSPIPQGGLEIPIQMTFTCNRYVTHMKMKNFISTLYVYGVEEETNDTEGGPSERIIIADDEPDLDASDDDDLIGEVALQWEKEEEDSQVPALSQPILVVYSESDDD